MKICVSAIAPGLDAQVDPRFGRCQYFTIVDVETMEHESFENPGMAASGGAGIQSAQFVINKGVEAVLTGNVGPNAYTALQAAGVKIFTGLGGTVRGMVEQYKRGNLEQPVSGPTVEPHFGMGNATPPSVGARSGMGIGQGMTGFGRGKGWGRWMGRLR